MFIICMYRVDLSQCCILREGTARQEQGKDLVSLAWKIKELSKLNKIGRAIGVLTTKLTGQCRWTKDNIPSQLKEIRQKLTAFIKGIPRHQCTPATHVLVFMISNEERDKKPYALPVQCIPCTCQT